MDPVKFDAVSPTPKSADIVYIQSQGYVRDGLETAWLLIQEHDGDRSLAARAMVQRGWSPPQSVKLCRGADQWTGEVVAGAVRDPFVTVIGR